MGSSGCQKDPTSRTRYGNRYGVHYPSFPTRVSIGEVEVLFVYSWNYGVQKRESERGQSKNKDPKIKSKGPMGSQARIPACTGFQTALGIPQAIPVISTSDYL